MAWIGAAFTGVASVISAWGDSKAKKAEAEARREEAIQQANAKIAEQKRLQAQYEADSQERIKQMENDHAQQELQLKAQREKEKQDHEARLEEMKNLKAKQDRESKIQQRDQSVNQCKQRIAKYKENIANANSKLTQNHDEWNDKKEKINVLNEKIQNFHSEKEKKLEKIIIKIGLKQAKLALDRVQNEINSAIELTSVHEDNVAKFLSLILNLVNATIANQDKSNYLNAELSTFNELIKRAGKGKLTVQQYFEDTSAERFVAMLAVEDMINMDDLKCEGDDAQEEFDEILEIIENGIKKEVDKWEHDKKTFEDDESNKNKKYDVNKPPDKLSRGNKRFLKKVCLKSKITWEEDQQNKIKLAKAILTDTAPPLAIFFNKINFTMAGTRLMLSYNNNVNDWQLTQEQRKAIREASYEDAKNNDNKDDGHNGDGNGMAVKLASELSPSGRKAFKQSMALNKAAIASINVVSSMKKENIFEGSAHGQLALGIGNSIESTCIEIVRNIGQIRESIVLAHCILRMKPANLNGRSKKLWNAVDSGIIQIFSNALEMSKVAANFFGFFARFEESFHYYIAAKNEKLMISTEHLRKDIKEFDKLTNDFNLKVRSLGNSALKCIADCVRNTAGAENFEKNRADRENKLEKYLSLKKIFDQEELKLDNQYSRMLDERADMKGKAATLKCVIDALQHQIKHDRDMMKKIEDTMNFLSQQVYSS